MSLQGEAKENGRNNCPEDFKCGGWEQEEERAQDSPNKRCTKDSCSEESCTKERAEAKCAKQSVPRKKIK